MKCPHDIYEINIIPTQSERERKKKEVLKKRRVQGVREALLKLKKAVKHVT